MTDPLSAAGESGPVGTATLHVRVTGRVQGVGYRAFVRATARTLGVVGWVCNQPDGSVEVAGQGPAASIQALADALRRGPAGARVAHVESLSATGLGQDQSVGFEVRHVPPARGTAWE